MRNEGGRTRIVRIVVGGRGALGGRNAEKGGLGVSIEASLLAELPSAQRGAERRNEKEKNGRLL